MTRACRFLLVASSQLLIPFALAQAQLATFAGAVVRDTLSHGISGALVLIPALDRSETTDAAGEFKFAGVPSGRYSVLVRHLGFVAMVDTVQLTTGQSTEREYVMDATPALLDSVHVTADRAPETMSPRMSQFEEHRKLGFGHFVTEDELRKNDSRKLNDVLTARIPSLSTYRPYPRTQPAVEWLSSGRGACAGPVLRCPPNAPCPVTLYVNGVLYFGAGASGDVPDVTRFQTNDVEAVEYYAGGATVPQQYNATGSGCGLLLLWLRE